MGKKQGMNLYDALYDLLNVEEKKDNPFETDAINEPFGVFCDKYIMETVDKPTDPNVGFQEIVGVFEEVQRNAFKIGFETAVSLIVKGGIQ